jgi:DNA ligase-1
LFWALTPTVWVGFIFPPCTVLCWALPTRFSELVELCRRLEATGSRLAKEEAIVEFLGRLEPGEARFFTYLLLGRKSGERGRPINVGWATISAALKLAEGPRLDVGFEPLTLGECWETLERIGRITGERAQERRVAALSSLFSRCSGQEREWLVRILSGEMRHGVNHGVYLEALAKFLRAGLEEVRYLDMFYSDLGVLAELAVRRELPALKLTVFRPVRCMLAEMAYSVGEALKEHGGKTCLEPKYDGVRLQIHIGGGEVRLFTRRLKDATGNLPDVVESVRGGVSAASAVLDSEVVALGADGKPLPFQDTMRRVGREKGVEEASTEIPLKLWVFDLLYLDGETLIRRPYHERRKILERIVVPELLTPSITVSDSGEGERVLQRALEEGHEGVVAKAMNSPYVPGRRGRLWLKIKKATTLDLVIIAAEWGHGRRRGWLSNYHLAVYDEERGSFVMVGKTFKGLSDAEFEAMTRRLLSIKTGEEWWGVTVRPEVVVEVAFNEVQRSPHYEGGLALRFARIVRIRDDKSPHEADTYKRLLQVFREQQERKGYYAGGEPGLAGREI